MKMSYWRFAAMIATSVVAMFVLMYLNTYALDHVRWSETRMWMALLMGATMAAIMLAFMLSMYRSRAINLAIFAGSALVFALSLWLVRSQATVDDTDYMKAMIPHHSIAVMTSERAQISDPRVRKLADEIIAAQRREIAEMKYLVARLEAGAQDAVGHDARTPPEVVAPAVAIGTAEVARIDPAELDQVEVRKVLGPGPHCEFRYSKAGGPVLSWIPASAGRPGRGLVKLNGRLVVLAVSSRAGTVLLQADGIEVALDAGGRDSGKGGPGVTEVDARLRLEAGLEVGYRGFRSCPPEPA